MSRPGNAPPGVLAPGRTGPSAPGPGSGGGEGGGRWAHLLTAPGAVEAEIVRGRLEAAGIPVALDARDPSPQAWMFPAGNARAPVRVLVPAALLDDARLELMEAGLATEDPGPQEPAMPPARRRPRWVVAAVLGGVAVVVLLVVEVVGSVTCALELFC